MALITSPPAPHPRQRQLRRLAQAGKLRKIHAGLYTDDLKSPLARITQREALAIAAILAPGAIISHRSALTAGPSTVLHLTGPVRRDVKVEGLSLFVHQGTGPLDTDIHIPTLVPGVIAHRSSIPRALLENLQITRSRAGREAASAGRAAVEAWLDTFLSRHNETAINDLRDKARVISAELSLEREFEILSSIIGALLGTRDVRLSHPQSIGRSQGFPYDGKRVDLFQKVAHYLNTKPPEVPRANAGTSGRMQSFIESYFSNYIEGTKFQIEEALQIVNSRSPQEFREDDSHDVIGTFDAIEESKAHPVVPLTQDGLEERLQAWNRQVLFTRASKNPGEWKVRANQAGASLFVQPDLVRGTLRKGFELIWASPLPESRAALAKFVVSEIHPFADGNGRVSRLLMNLILSEAGLTRIVIPTVFHEDYILALKALTNDGHTEPYVRMLTRAAQFSWALDYGDQGHLLQQLDRSNAKKEPAEAKLNLAAHAD
jgi:hypothetical protein